MGRFRFCSGETPSPRDLKLREGEVLEGAVGGSSHFFPFPGHVGSFSDLSQEDLVGFLAEESAPL